MAKTDRETKKIVLEQNDVIVYAREDAGRKTSKNFVMQPGQPVVVGLDVTIAYGQQLFDSGKYKLDEDSQPGRKNAAKHEPTETAKEPVKPAEEGKKQVSVPA